MVLIDQNLAKTNARLRIATHVSIYKPNINYVKFYNKTLKFKYIINIYVYINRFIWTYTH